MDIWATYSTMTTLEIHSSSDSVYIHCCITFDSACTVYTVLGGKRQLTFVHNISSLSLLCNVVFIILVKLWIHCSGICDRHGTFRERSTSGTHRFFAGWPLDRRRSATPGRSATVWPCCWSTLPSHCQVQWSIIIRPCHMQAVHRCSLFLWKH